MNKYVHDVTIEVVRYQDDERGLSKDSIEEFRQELSTTLIREAVLAAIQQGIKTPRRIALIGKLEIE